MNRRGLVSQLVAVLFLPRLGIARAASPDSSAAGPLHALFKRPDAVQRIGRAYLSAVPGERDEVRLRELVFARWRAEVRDGAFRDPEVLRQLLRAQSRDDFRHDRVVQVDGWLLSKTEVRICALLAVAS